MSKKMFQFLVALLIVALASIAPGLPASAAGVKPTEVPIPEYLRETKALATVSEVGGTRVFVLTPALVETTKDSSGRVSVTYEVGVPLESFQDNNSASLNLLQLFPVPALAASDSHTGCDSTSSVCAVLTLNYVDAGSHGYYQNLTNKWTRSDPTVIWSAARLQAGCSAEWYQGSGRCSAQVSQNVGTPTSGTVYSQTPWFSGSSNRVIFNDLNGIAAWQFITLQRGATIWNFSFCVSHHGGSVILGCH